ncbi:MAG: hypothetical protein ACXADY_20005 [Candidatus Hodarchaeales archaeon]
MDLNFDILNNKDVIATFALSQYYKDKSGDMTPDSDLIIRVNIAARASVNMPIVSELNNRQWTFFPSGTSPDVLARGN